MLKNSFLILAALAIAGCASDVSTTEESAKAPTPSKPSSQVTQVGELSYRVLVTKGGETALVGRPQQRGSFKGRDVEAAAEQVTGCEATIVPGEWSFLGDLNNFELSNLRTPETRPFPAWPVELRC